MTDSMAVQFDKLNMIKCYDKTLYVQVKLFQFAKCTFSLLVIAGVVLSDPPITPCGGLFGYKFDGSDWHGLITLNNIRVNQTVINIIAELSLPTSLPSPYNGRIDLLEEQQQAVRAVLQGRPLHYRISFPLKNPIPRVTRIVVNDDVLCSGPADKSPQMTGFKLYHVFYPNISEYPGKIEETSNGNEDATSKDASSTFSRISQQKCNEYKSLVYEAVSSDGAIRTDRCVNADVSSSNTENENPFLGEFPHMALIAYGNLGWFCNGVLISEEYVLTSGRCAKFSTKPKYVGFRINKDNDDDTVEVSKVIHHPEYNAPFRYNDIALMKLDRKVKLSPYIRPACLPTTHQLNSTSISTGWGTPQNHVYPFKFRKVKMDIIPEDICGKYYGQTNPYLKLGPGPPRRICVKPHREEKRTHFPDGSDGSPLQQSHNEHYCMYTVTGILITHGGEVGLPVMYTKVYSYLDWIEGIVWGNSS